MVIDFRRNLRTRWPEWVLSYGMIFLGVLFIGANKTIFDHQIYDGMKMISGSAMAWGVVMTLIASTRMVGLFLNGFWPFSYTIRVVTAVISVPIWYQVFALYWTYDALVPGIVLSQIPLFIEVTNIIFATQERRHLWDKTKNGTD